MTSSRCMSLPLGFTPRLLAILPVANPQSGLQHQHLLGFAAGGTNSCRNQGSLKEASVLYCVRKGMMTPTWAIVPSNFTSRVDPFGFKGNHQSWGSKSQVCHMWKLLVPHIPGTAPPALRPRDLAGRRRKACCCDAQGGSFFWRLGTLGPLGWLKRETTKERYYFGGAPYFDTSPMSQNAEQETPQTVWRPFETSSR